MLKVVHKVASWILKRRIEQMEYFMAHPHEVQAQVFKHLVAHGALTTFGRKYGLRPDVSLRDFQAHVPISTYEELYPWIEKEFYGGDSILWPGKRKWFSKSSGTTNDKSKYIPVTEESLEECHYKAGQDMLAMYFDQNPESQLFTGKGLSIGGSLYDHPEGLPIRYGDVSAVITENLPRFYELARTPRKEVAFMSSWEEKIDVMARELYDEDVTSFAGVPTWTIVLIHHLLDTYGIEDGDIRAIWPNLEVFFHGGVSFEPYRTQFDRVISGKMSYMDIYNASEGYFAFQHDLTKRDLLLLLDHGVFYEFVPLDRLDEDHPPAFTLDQIELGVNYAMVITTNAGLWRYLIGDTVIFTGRYPYTIQITGRTKHFINAFGEELMVDNAETAIADAATQTGAIVSNYTAGPVFIDGKSKGGHEWYIEFEEAPSSLQAFQMQLDTRLRQLNSDYEAKRQADLALVAPRIHALPAGTFHRWMKKRGKLGGQHKVPRLANHRRYLDELAAILAHERR
ncbi:MAG: GH3 auxin-responsive promoter family protein [Bacteroidota bacterium]